ncbi:MAG: putative molibdopterin-dependent oxidoreductase YjgC [Paraglaciecola sp.]|jgi:predicted molibdopterin-dependent oxidoreductase YjgC
MSSSFCRLDEPGREWIKVEIDGETVRVAAGETIAAAILASGIQSCRTTPLSGEPRAPFCMMGVCFECLMNIDGVPNRQTCQIPVQQGMKIRRQLGCGKGYV